MMPDLLLRPVVYLVSNLEEEVVIRHIFEAEESLDCSDFFLVTKLEYAIDEFDELTEQCRASLPTVLDLR
jgi:hypothetical protein